MKWFTLIISFAVLLSCTKNKIKLNDQLPKDTTHAVEENKSPDTSDQALTLAPSETPTYTVYFNFDSYALSNDSRQILEFAAKTIKSDKIPRINIEGHCDERGSAEYNIVLAQARADVAKKYLIDLGIPDHKIFAISFGKEKPVFPGHDEEAWSKNRRAEIRFKS